MFKSKEHIFGVGWRTRWKRPKFLTFDLVAMQLRSYPPLSQALLALLFAISLVHHVLSLTRSSSPSNSDFLVLVPQRALFQPWVYFTAAFAEPNIITLLLAGFTIFYGGNYLERAWESREFGKFVLVVTLISNFVASLLYVALFAITRDDDSAWTTIQGSVALQAAFLVAFKQLVPEHTVTVLKGIFKVRVKHFPSIFLLAHTVCGFVFRADTTLVLAWIGFFTSWTYLRFYKTQVDLSGVTAGGVSMRGDASETFAFAYFWPDLVQPPIAAFADRIYKALVALRICTPFAAQDIESSNDPLTVMGESGRLTMLNPEGGREGKKEEAERRRALALKALDQRLSAATAKNHLAGPSASIPSTNDVETHSTGGISTEPSSN